MGAWTYSIIMLTFSLSCLSLVLLKIRTVVDRDFDKTIITWQGWQDLNPRHAVLETAALPTELHPYGVLKLDYYMEYCSFSRA